MTAQRQPALHIVKEDDDTTTPDRDADIEIIPPDRPAESFVVDSHGIVHPDGDISPLPATGRVGRIWGIIALTIAFVLFLALIL